MATVVHHEADRPWIDAFNNAITAGSQSIATQNMERDKLAVQISENAKQRALDSYLTGMRIKGRYVNAKMTNETAKAQHAILNANNAKTLELAINRDERAKSEVLKDQQEDIADAEMTSLVAEGIENSTYGVDKNGQVIVVDKGSPKYQQIYGTPLKYKLPIQKRIAESLKNKNLSSGMRQLGLGYKEGVREHIQKLQANLPFINALIAKDETLPLVQSWMPVDDDTNQPYTKEDILKNKDGVLTSLAGLNQKLVTDTLKDRGLIAGTTSVETLANLAGMTKADVSNHSRDYMLYTGNAKIEKGIGVDTATGKLTRPQLKHDIAVSINANNWREHAKDPFKSGSNLGLVQPLVGTYRETLTRSVNAMIPHFTAIQHDKKFVFKDPASVTNNIAKRFSALIEKDKNILSKSGLIAVQNASPLDKKILKFIRAAVPTIVKNDQGEDVYSDFGEKLTPGDVYNLGREIAYGFLAAKQRFPIGTLDALSASKNRNLATEATEWEKTNVIAEADPEIQDGSNTLIASSSAHIPTDVRNPQDGTLMPTVSFIQQGPFNGRQRESFKLLTSEKEVKKVAQFMDGKLWTNQSPRAVVNRVFGKAGKKYLDGLKQAEAGGDKEATVKLDAWYALRRKTIMNAMTQSNKFPWQDKATGWNFMDFLDWKIKKDGHKVIGRKWLDEAMAVNDHGHSGTPTLQQLDFILSAYNVQRGDTKRDEGDSMKRGFSYDVQDMLNELRQTKAYRQMETVAQGGSGSPNLLDSSASGSTDTRGGAQQDAGIEPYGANSQYKYPGIYTNL